MPVNRPRRAEAPLLHHRCKLAAVVALHRSGHDAVWVDPDTALLGPPPLPPPGGAAADLAGCRERGYHVNSGLLWWAASPRGAAAAELAFLILHVPAEEFNSELYQHWADQAVIAQLFALEGVSRDAYPRLALEGLGAAGRLLAQRAANATAVPLPRALHACRANNRREVPLWREAARSGELRTAHASGRCGDTLWGKKGFLIEMRAWADGADVERYFDHPQNAALGRFRWGVAADA
eukprot:TRINITY_DN9387_c0_g1_i2.p2 TRINITY_DN9387_c0_g1~~TRINITY_DN9387_c0_g1_i2.p2  ORF type:complete len:237 (+),score=43.85 TRINITY_DN9387_c0_g1_i2:1023-1733(+)